MNVLKKSFTLLNQNRVPLVFILILVFFPLYTFAAPNSIFTGCGGEDLTAADVGRNELRCVVISAIQIILEVVGAIILLMFVISGLFYITSAGDPNRTGHAKKTLVGAIIGLIIVILSFVMVTTVKSFF